jgi:hypothetical protein
MPAVTRKWSEPLTIYLERGRLRRFALAIGESDPRYVNVEHARAAGHPDLPVPLTYPFTLESDYVDTLDFAVQLGIDPLSVLHGEQQFTYEQALHAGDQVNLRTSILSDTVKGSGRLRSIVRESEVSVDGRPACTLRSTWLVLKG